MKKIKTMKHVTIVGVGALGSHLALLLRNEEVRMTLVDFDRVESKNLQSQFHTKMGSGKLKVSALTQSLQGLWGVKVTGVPFRLISENVQQILSGNDLVVDCVDNAKTRTLIQDFCVKEGISCLHGALAPNGEYGRVVWTENFKIDDETGIGAATCEDGAFLPYIVEVSAFLARSVQVFLKTGKKVGYEISPASVFST